MAWEKGRTSNIRASSAKPATANPQAKPGNLRRLADYALASQRPRPGVAKGEAGQHPISNIQPRRWLLCWSPPANIRPMKLPLFVLAILLGFSTFAAEIPRALPPGEVPQDVRLGPLKELDGYFPFTVPESREAWA